MNWKDIMKANEELKGTIEAQAEELLTSLKELRMIDPFNKDGYMNNGQTLIRALLDFLKGLKEEDYQPSLADRDD